MLVKAIEVTLVRQPEEIGDNLYRKGTWNSCAAEIVRDVDTNLGKYGEEATTMRTDLAKENEVAIYARSVRVAAKSASLRSIREAVRVGKAVSATFGADRFKVEWENIYMMVPRAQTLKKTEEKFLAKRDIRRVSAAQPITLQIKPELN